MPSPFFFPRLPTLLAGIFSTLSFFFFNFILGRFHTFPKYSSQALLIISLFFPDPDSLEFHCVAFLSALCKHLSSSKYYIFLLLSNWVVARCYYNFISIHPSIHTPDGIRSKCATISKTTTSIVAVKIPLLILFELPWMAAKTVTVPTVHTTDLLWLLANACFVARQDKEQASKTINTERKVLL